MTTPIAERVAAPRPPELLSESVQLNTKYSCLSASNELGAERTETQQMVEREVRRQRPSL
jgi:hypothetical protein